ncbi:MAG TPA: universal stress protein [Acidimicrobiales bacterium]|nr:universal stress protein [Acidimicrobiales bacterium]
MTSQAETAGGAVRYRRVLVPLDGSRFAAAALRTARALSTRFGAELHAVSVAEHDDEVEVLRSEAAAALGPGAGPEQIHVVVGDDAAGAIAATAADLGSALICMSTHGRGRIVGAVVGSVARSLLQAAREPIVVVGPVADRPRPFAESAPPVPLSVPRLVACVDGTPPSETLLPVAGRWADALGMSLTIVTVAEPSPPPVRADAAWHRRHGPEEDADAYAAGLRERFKDVAAEVDAKVVYDPISPADGLRTYLDRHPAGLVAVTTHARTGLRRILLGADAANIVHASTAPTLVVPLSGG